MKWNNFTYRGQIYDLSHLDAFEWGCIQEAKKGKPSIKYKFHIIFGLHCFTDHIDNGVTDKELFYSDSRETRAFCFHRYALSIKLPGIVESLHKRKIYHTTAGG